MAGAANSAGFIIGISATANKRCIANAAIIFIRHAASACSGSNIAIAYRRQQRLLFQTFYQ